MAKSNESELIQHTVSVRYRVYGTGVMRTRLIGYQEVTFSVLPTIAMLPATDRFMSILANYSNQRTQLEFKTTGYDDTFVISKIVAFATPSAAGYPQL